MRERAGGGAEQQEVPLPQRRAALGDRDGADQRDDGRAEQRDRPEHQGEPVDDERAGRRAVERADDAEGRSGSGPRAGPRSPAATTTATTVSVAGTSAARRLRGGPAKASTSEHDQGADREHERRRDRRPVDVLRQRHPRPPKNARAASPTGPSSRPGATPSTRVSDDQRRPGQPLHAVHVARARAPAVGGAGVDLGGRELDRRRRPR